MNRRPVQLVLGSGGARGLSFVGVLEVLRAEGIPVSSVIGSSMGALVGAAYCECCDTDKVKELVSEASLWRLVRPAFVGAGVLSRKPVERIVGRALSATSFEALRVPLTVVCTDLRKGEAVAFTSGSLLPPLVASCLPTGMFEPTRHLGTWLADGGYSAPLPVDFAAGDDPIVVVDPSVNPTQMRLPERANALSPLARGRLAAQFGMSAIDALIWRLGRMSLERRGSKMVVITPQLGDMSPMSFSQAAWAVAQGADAARGQLGALAAIGCL